MPNEGYAKKFVPSSLPLGATYPTRLCLQKWFKMMVFSMFSSVLKTHMRIPVKASVWHRQEGQGGDGICLYLPRGEEAGKMGTEAKGATRQCHGLPYLFSQYCP